jgi:hypothetical protein
MIGDYEAPTYLDIMCFCKKKKMRFFPEIHGYFVSKPIFSKNEFFSTFFGKKDMNVEFVTGTKRTKSKSISLSNL